jgi:hypothetical protein
MGLLVGLLLEGWPEVGELDDAVPLGEDDVVLLGGDGAHFGAETLNPLLHR